MPSEFVAAFRRYYGPTMNAFDAAEQNGRATDLQRELEALFDSQNKSPAPGRRPAPGPPPSARRWGGGEGGVRGGVASRCLR